MWAAVVASVWLGMAPGLEVETTTPDALCPDLPQLRRSIQARLGLVTVEGDRGWTARTTVGHAPGKQAADFVRLELFDPAGDRRLQRDLPLDGESCATMAQIIALVLERYFHGLGWSAGAQLPGRGGGAPPEETASTPPPAGAAPAEETPVALAIRAGGGVPAPDPAAAAELGLRLALSSRFALGLSALLPPRHRDDASSVPSTPAHLAAVPLRLGLEIAGGDRLAFLAGPEALVSIERGSTRLEQNTRVVLGIGVQAGVAVSILPRLALELRGAVDYALPLAMSKFQVGSREVLAAPPVQGSVTAGVRFTVAP